jgi:thioredoxin-like negative regulator of GroEL
MDSVIRVTNLKQYDKLLKNKRVIIFYSLKGCDACTVVEDLYNRIARRYRDKIALAYADVEECGLDFEHLPVFVFFYQGKEVDSLVGSNKEGLRDFIAKSIKHR